MTTITIGKNYINVRGHSGYDVYGKDIVCAAISTLIEATFNYLLETGNCVEKKDKEAFFEISLKDNQSYNQPGVRIIKSFEKMIKDLVKQYPKNICLEKRN